MAGKGSAGGGQWSQQQQQQQQLPQPVATTTSSHLLSPNSAATSVGNRRRSTLSNHGFFIEYSNRRNSSTLNQQRQPLAHMTLVSPVRALPANIAHESPQSPVRAPVAGRQSRASCSAGLGQHLGPQYARVQSLMPPITAPSALVGSRKTSIFDPAGHSLASSQLLLSPSTAASCDVTRRRSTMTMGPAALAAQQQMLAVAKSHTAAGVHGKRRQTLVQQVPVIGCSPTSIQGSLKALDESRRYEKMLHKLKEQQKQRERCRRKRRRKSHISGLHRSTSHQEQPHKSTATRQGSNSFGKAIKDAAKSLLGSKASHPYNPDKKSLLCEQARLSISTLSLGSWSTSESGTSSGATSDSEFSSSPSSAASLSPTSEHPTLAHRKSNRPTKQRNYFMSQAFRKLASLSASSPSVDVRRSTRSAPSGLINQNYWHYYYYLKENSIDQSPCVGVDEPLVAGEPLSPSKRRERLNANFSLTRLEILNCEATCRPNPGELLKAQELAAQGKPDMLANMFSQSTDISLALSTSSSSQSSTYDLSITSTSSHADRDTDEPQESSTEGWSVASSVHLESVRGRLSTSDESNSTSTTKGQSKRPICLANSAPSSRDTPTIETSLTTKYEQPVSSRSRPHLSLSKSPPVTVTKQQQQQQQDEEEEDDFDRLSRCHRGYKLAAPELLEVMQQQELPKRSRRNSSQRLSVRSVRSIGSPGRPTRDGSAAKSRGISSNNLTNTHGISLSWGTLDQVQTGPRAFGGPPLTIN